METFHILSVSSTPLRPPRRCLTSVTDDLLVGLDGLHVHALLLVPDAEHPPAPPLLPLLGGRELLHRLHALLEQLSGFGLGQVV